MLLKQEKICDQRFSESVEELLVVDPISRSIKRCCKCKSTYIEKNVEDKNLLRDVDVDTPQLGN
jgi:hypothetical protein